MTVALAIPHAAAMVAGALAGGYLVGAVPVAAAALALRRRRRGHVVPAATPRIAGRRGNAVLELLAEGGVRIAVVVLLLELLKGGVVGLGARLYDDTSWFAATAIAGCVVGDAFPPRRPGRRGIVPLVSGTFAALPGTWAAGAFVAVPALFVLLLGGVAYDVSVAVCVPVAMVLGTHDLRTLLPAAVIVAALVGRSRLRRRGHERAMATWRQERDRSTPVVVDVPSGLPGPRP